MNTVALIESFYRESVQVFENVVVNVQCEFLTCGLRLFDFVEAVFQLDNIVEFARVNLAICLLAVL